MSNELPQSKAELLAIVHQGYDNFPSALDGLSVAQMETPGVTETWSVKDSLAHVTWWQREMVAKWQGQNLLGELFPRQGDESWDERLARVNQGVYEQNRDRPFADVLDDFREMHRRVVQGIEAMSDAQLADPELREDIVSTAGEHFAEHGAMIRARRERMTTT